MKLHYYYYFLKGYRLATFGQLTTPSLLTHTHRLFVCGVAPFSSGSEAMSTHTSEHHHGTAILKEIAVDYCPEVCLHTPEADEIHITFDHRGGARWRSHHRFQYGVFGGRIKCPAGNTSGLNFNIYLSSLEGDKSQVILLFRLICVQCAYNYNYLFCLFEVGSKCVPCHL
jgi:Glycosyl hydrolases family 16